MNRTIYGVPIWGWVAVVTVFGGGLWYVKRNQSKSASATPTKSAPAAFSQQQEIQDFQVYSQLSSAQQASDLSFIGQIAGLLGGGKSNGTSGGGTATTGGGTTGGGGGGGTGTAPGTAPASGGPPPIQTVTVGGTKYKELGSVTAGGKYTGYNVVAGNPVYASVGGAAPAQGFSTSTMSPGETLYAPANTPTNQIGTYVSTSSSY